MLQGYYPVIQALSEDLDIRLNHRYTLIKCSINLLLGRNHSILKVLVAT